jgi:hypothetical protein
MDAPLRNTLELVTITLSEVESNQVALSSIIRKCIRVARLRNDCENLWWLELEMIPFTHQEEWHRVRREVAPRFSQAQCKALHERFVKVYAEERATRSLEGESLVNKGEVCGLSVEELEDRVISLQRESEAAVPSSGLHPTDLYFVDQNKSKYRGLMAAQVSDIRDILSRIRHRVHSFLSQSEKQLVYGQLNSDIFEQNRRYVDLRMRDIAPEALEKFVTVYQRLGEGNPEARAQALTSCRRILKALADVVYPPRQEKVEGADGKMRDLSEEKYVARLWQFVSERVGAHSAGQLLQATLSDLGNRIDRVYELSCKGVHVEVSEFELNQCVIQTYLLVGDILRLTEPDSGIEGTEGGPSNRR